MDADQSPLGAYEAAVRRHEAGLTVGTRVRVMLNSECKHYHDGDPGGNALGQQRLLIGHHASVNGFTGRVVQIDPPGIVWSGHRFSVITDQPLPRSMGRSVYAAAELIVLDTGAGADDREATASQPSPESRARPPRLSPHPS